MWFNFKLCQDKKFLEPFILSLIHPGKNYSRFVFLFSSRFYFWCMHADQWWIMDKCSFLPNIFGGKCDMVGIEITFYKLERERESKIHSCSFSCHLLDQGEMWNRDTEKLSLTACFINSLFMQIIESLKH